MSTVSLMPVGKKIRVKREIRIPIINILSTGMHLQQMGLIIGKTLILDENSVFRIEAFSAAVKDKSYPSTKITVFPENSKAGSLYIELDGLDGLSWETVDELQKPTPKPIRRIDVKIDREIDVTYCWSQIFKGNYGIVIGEESPEVVINPLVLDEHHLADARFIESSNYKIADATVKIDKNVFVYEIQTVIDHCFEIGANIRSHGFSLLSAKLSEISVKLQIRRSFGQWNHLTALNLDELSKDSITKAIATHLTTLHEL